MIDNKKPTPPASVSGEVVTQADRDAAALVYGHFRDHDYAGWVRNGTNAMGGADTIVQAFARHRLAAAPEAATPSLERDAIAADIARIAGCQVGSERTRKIVDYILARDVAPSAVGGVDRMREAVGREMTAELDRRRVLTLAKLEAHLRSGRPRNMRASERDKLHAEVLMALGIEDEDSPGTMAEVIVEMQGRSGHGIVDRMTAPSGSIGEPFGYWVEQRFAEPALLRKPAYIPEPSDLRTVTPLYTALIKIPQLTGVPVEVAADLREAVEYAIGAVSKEADRAMSITRASRPVVEEIEERERRFKRLLEFLPVALTEQPRTSESNHG